MHTKPSATLDKFAGTALMTSEPTFLGMPLNCYGCFEPEREEDRQVIADKLLEGTMLYCGKIKLPKGKVISACIDVSWAADTSFGLYSDDPLLFEGPLDLSLTP